MRNLDELIKFLTQTMSMTEVYQPALILYLLENGGDARKEELARVLSGYDASVQEYYAKILMRWPKMTLTKHNVINYDRRNKRFKLNFDLDDHNLIEEAKSICEQKIKAWISRAKGPATSQLTPSKRYRILKAAKSKCELCGISAKISPIDIDHIVPQSKADKKGNIVKDGYSMHVDDERDLQALCYRCNRAKRDKDSTDFRHSSKKLVRDKIPDVIRASGRTPVVKELKGSQLRMELLEKLVEEHVELLNDTVLEEIVDMIEVLIEISRNIGYTETETLQFVQKKREERGSFKQGFYLERIET